MGRDDLLRLGKGTSLDVLKYGLAILLRGNMRWHRVGQGGDDGAKNS